MEYLIVELENELWFMSGNSLRAFIPETLDVLANIINTGTHQEGGDNYDGFMDWVFWLAESDGVAIMDHNGLLVPDEELGDLGWQLKEEYGVFLEPYSGEQKKTTGLGFDNLVKS